MIKCLENIPEKWKVGRVKDIFYISKDKAHQKDPVILSLARDGIKVRDISNNEGQIAESYENYNPVKPGDLLLNPMDLYSGANCNMSLVEGVISPAYVNLRKKYKDISPKFYDYYFKVQYWTMNMFAHGKGVSFDNRWTLNAEGVLNFEIPILSGEEQQRIADFLDKKCSQIERLIKLQENEIEKLKIAKNNLITNTILKGFNKSVSLKDSPIIGDEKIPEHWKMFRFKNILQKRKDSIRVGPFGSSLKGTDIIPEGKYWVYNQRTVLDQNFDTNETYVTEEKFNELQGFVVNAGDVLVTTRGSIGKIAKVPEIYKEGVIHPCIIRCLIDESVYKYELLEYIFNESDFIINQFKRLSNGTTIDVVYSDTLRNIYLPYIPFNEQELIIKFLNEECGKFNKLIQIKKNKLEKLQDYKKSLIYECVTGKKEI